MIHLLVDLGVDSIKKLDEKDDQDQVVNDCLKVKEVSISRVSIKPCDPHEESIEGWENNHISNEQVSLNILVGKSKVAADQQELNHLNVKQKWVLIEHNLNESHEEQGVALKSEHSSLVLLKVRLGAQSNHCVSSSDQLSHLEDHYHTEN